MLQHVIFVYGFNLNVARRLVRDLTAEQMCQQPHGVVNHPAWSLGHLAAASVGLLKALGHEASLPEGWGEAFKTGGIPIGDPSGTLRRTSCSRRLSRCTIGSPPPSRLSTPRRSRCHIRMKARASIFRPSATWSCF